MLRAFAILCTLVLLAACSATTQRVSSNSESLRNARAAAPPMLLGISY